jgi:hypothetical protein
VCWHRLPGASVRFVHWCRGMGHHIRKSLSGRHLTVLMGVYVLGGLRGRQEDRVRAHLTRCPRCWAEYEDLAEVPLLLNMITAEEAADAAGLTQQVYAKDALPRLLSSRGTSPGHWPG